MYQQAKRNEKKRMGRIPLALRKWERNLPLWAHGDDAATADERRVGPTKPDGGFSTFIDGRRLPRRIHVLGGSFRQALGGSSRG